MQMQALLVARMDVKVYYLKNILFSKGCFGNVVFFLIFATVFQPSPVMQGLHQMQRNSNH